MNGSVMYKDIFRIFSKFVSGVNEGDYERAQIAIDQMQAITDNLKAEQEKEYQEITGRAIDA